MTLLDYQPLPVAPYKRTGLIVFGVVTIVFGTFFVLGALAMPLIALLSAAMPNSGMPRQDWRSLVASAIVYVGMAALFIWAGIGCVRARRWVRPIMLIIAWTWLLTGVIAITFFLFTASDINSVIQAQNPNVKLPGGFAFLFMFIAIAFLFVFYIAIPGAYVWFFRRPVLQEALNYFDPIPTWTDRCPLSVLGVSLGLAVGALTTPISLLYNTVPCFGIILTGLPAAAIMFVLALGLAYTARETYHLRPLGWWLSMLLFLFLPLSGVITFARIDYLEVYARMGIPADQIALMRQYKTLNNTTIIIWLALLALVGVIYMLFIRKHFTRSR